MRKLGLVLQGGGGKGAYHIGVWKALRKHGIDRQVRVVAGTSVGALNAALFMLGDYLLAEDIWLNITRRKILSVTPRRILERLYSMFRGLHVSPSAKLNSCSNRDVVPGWCSRNGMLRIMNNRIDLDAVASSPIVGYATCFSKNYGKPVYYKLNENGRKRIADILLASSALPRIFDAVIIDGEQYVDGGVIGGDNTPIEPVHSEGCDRIIVVHVDRTEMVRYDNYPKDSIVEIIPSRYQGGYRGVFDFSPKGARRRIEDGYRDAIHILSTVSGISASQKYVDNQVH